MFLCKNAVFFLIPARKNERVSVGFKTEHVQGDKKSSESRLRTKKRMFYSILRNKIYKRHLRHELHTILFLRSNK
jgi:hypothetical protein